ncbi:MAG: hypothetical protein ACFFHD_06965 [Promethearchaeota archaeon]
MQENQNLKKENLYIILLGYTVSYTLFIISQLFYYPITYSYLTFINLIILIEVMVVLIQLYSEKIEYAFIIGMYPLSYIILKILQNTFIIGTHSNMGFGGDPPIQVYISFLFLQPICIIALVTIYFFINKYKEMETYNDKTLNSEKPLYLHWGIHLIIGVVLSFFIINVFSGIFDKSFI